MFEKYLRIEKLSGSLKTAIYYQFNQQRRIRNYIKLLCKTSILKKIWFSENYPQKEQIIIVTARKVKVRYTLYAASLRN